MIASRGMGNINPKKKPRNTTISQAPDPKDATRFAKGSGVGLYANINAKRKRIASGSGEKMRGSGAKGAPTAASFQESAKTVRKK